MAAWLLDLAKVDLLAKLLTEVESVEGQLSVSGGAKTSHAQIDEVPVALLRPHYVVLIMARIRKSCSWTSVSCGMQMLLLQVVHLIFDLLRQ